jgi:hypothetical protein
MQMPPALRASTSDDGLVLLNVETGEIYTSNAVGSRIWRLLEQGRGEAEIAACLSLHYGQPEAAIAADVSEFLGGLRTLGVRLTR